MSAAVVIAMAVIRLGLRLDVGLEYDSNANRAEVLEGATAFDTPTGSPLLRASLRGNLAWRKGRSTLSLGGALGGKLFFLPSVLDQNMLVGQLAIDERIQAARILAVNLHADYYDAGQLSEPCGGVACNRHRDFRTGTGTLSLHWLPRDVDLVTAVGYRGFQYKPEAGYDFHAVLATAQVVLRRDLGQARDHELDLVFGYQFERRFFDARSTAPPAAPECQSWSAVGPSCVPTLGAEDRRDSFHQLSVDLTYVGRVLFGIGYAGQLNQSSSYQQTFYRHLASIKLGLALPWRLYATVKAQLMATIFKDPVLIDQRVLNQTFITAEDENRNALFVDLSRPVGRRGVALYARYSVFTNQLSAAPAAFLRHLVTLGLTWKIGR